jgi:hypothetical protein
MTGDILVRPVGNANQPWDEFDSAWYVKHNYKSLRTDDRRIIQLMVDFFASARGRRRLGVDVGSGPNLYPALAMLPWCREITMIERAATNVGWLRSAVGNYASSWDPFWRTMVERRPEAYRRINPRAALGRKTTVIEGDIFKLPADQYDVGTMFFVAESITGDKREFERATLGFIRSLRWRAPFAAAFMKNSLSYPVGAQRYPAVAVNENSVREFLARVAYGLEIHFVTDVVNPLHEGYEGMILATGYAGKKM